MNALLNARTKIFADGADLSSMLKLAEKPWIRGFTTNPTLMRQAGIRHYEGFAKEVLAAITDRPISFEVFSDDVGEMHEQAMHIASWGSNVYVKIPVSNTLGESTESLVRSLIADGVQVNVTAVMTQSQISRFSAALEGRTRAYLSIFAGRIADSGRDPVPVVARAVQDLKRQPNVEVLWASPREILNLVQANAIGCHVITMTPELLQKASNLGKDLEQFSLETVQMFRRDAVAAGFSLVGAPVAMVAAK